MLSLSPVTFKPGDAASFVAVYFPDAKPQPNGQWLVSCPCPTHGKGRGDRNPSLSIAQGKKGITLYDFTGCTHKEICDALGVREADLFQPEDKPHTNGNGSKRTEWVYRDEHGNPLYKKVRLDPPFGRKKYFQDRWENGRWVNGLDNVRPVLYRLPELLAADPTETCYWVEGEKCAERVAAEGKLVTTSGSATSWTPEIAQQFAPLLAKRVLVLLPDHDREGFEHARKVMQDVQAVGGNCIFVDLFGDDEPDNADVYDWLEAGNTMDGLEWEMSKPVELPTPDASYFDDEPMSSVDQLKGRLAQRAEPPAPERPQRYQVIHADELDAMPPVEWLEPDEIAAGQFNLVWGPSQGGKSFYMLDRALHIAQTHPVLYVAAEDAQGYAARKIAWCKHHGMGAGQLYFVPQPVNLFDASAVADFIDQVARPISPVLIVFDTLARCMVGADENSSRDIGIVVENLEWVRRDTAAAVCPVHHAGKDGKTYRGSSALFAAAYTSVEVSKDDDAITVTSDKAKNTAEFKPRKFRLVQVETGRVLPDGQPETSCVFLPSEQVDDSHDKTLKGSQRRILEMLAWETFVSTGAKSAIVGKTLGLEGSRLYTPLSKLLKRGYVRQAVQGDPYYITDTGLLALVGSVADRKNSTPLQ